MTKYTVIGVDRASSLDTELIIEAASAANARVKAELNGIVVTEVVESDPRTRAGGSAAKNESGLTAPPSGARHRGISMRQQLMLTVFLPVGIGAVAIYHTIGRNDRDFQAHPTAAIVASIIPAVIGMFVLHWYCQRKRGEKTNLMTLAIVCALVVSAIFGVACWLPNDLFTGSHATINQTTEVTKATVQPQFPQASQPDHDGYSPGAISTRSAATRPTQPNVNESLPDSKQDQQGPTATLKANLTEIDERRRILSRMPLVEILRLVDVGDSSAMWALSLRYLTGQDVPLDKSKGIEWVRKAVEAGDSRSYLLMGYLYENGNGVKEDHTEAMEWYNKGLANGDVRAMQNIGGLYEKQKRYSDALEWYRKGAEAGDGLAMYMIGNLYERGDGVARDYETAHAWYRKGAEAGDPGAIAKTAMNFATGFGVAKDEDEAIRWYRNGAAFGDGFCTDQLKERGLQ